MRFLMVLVRRTASEPQSLGKWECYYSQVCWLLPRLYAVAYEHGGFFFFGEPVNNRTIFCPRWCFPVRFPICVFVFAVHMLTAMLLAARYGLLWCIDALPLEGRGINPCAVNLRPFHHPGHTRVRVHEPEQFLCYQDPREGCVSSRNLATTRDHQWSQSHRFSSLNQRR